MNRKQQGVVLAGLLALALAGCSSTKTGSGDEMAAGATAGGAATTSPSSAAPPSGAAATAATETPMPSQPQAKEPAAMPAMQPNAVVVSIETVPRTGAAGSGAVGSSGTAGAIGSSTGEDKQYRVTLRMDDGATRVVTQDKAPAFRNGDRVNMMDGVISR